MSLRDALNEVGMTTNEFLTGVISFCICICFVITLCRMALSADSAASEAATEKTYYAVTTKHDGHLFVVVRGHGGILHHPDCQCRERTAGAVR